MPNIFVFADWEYFEIRADQDSIPQEQVSRPARVPHAYAYARAIGIARPTSMIDPRLAPQQAQGSRGISSFLSGACLGNAPSSPFQALPIVYVLVQEIPLFSLSYAQTLENRSPSYKRDMTCKGHAVSHTTVELSDFIAATDKHYLHCRFGFTLLQYVEPCPTCSAPISAKKKQLILFSHQNGRKACVPIAYHVPIACKSRSHNRPAGWPELPQSKG